MLLSAQYQMSGLYRAIGRRLALATAMLLWLRR